MTDTDDIDEEEPTCPDCEGTGTTWIDRWSYSRGEHYTQDVPCGCMSGTYERKQRKREADMELQFEMLRDEIPF